MRKTTHSCSGSGSTERHTPFGKYRHNSSPEGIGIGGSGSSQGIGGSGSSQGSGGSGGFLLGERDFNSAGFGSKDSFSDARTE